MNHDLASVIEKIKKIKFPFATLAIITFATVIYILNSNGNPYIYPISKLAIYGVSNVNPIIGGIMFSFTHLGLKHLMGNMLVLGILGTILEQRMKSWKVFTIFLMSGWFAGVVYTYINPNVWVLGSSAAICGLIGAGLLVDFKRTILGVVLGLYMIPIVAYPTADWIVVNFYNHQEKAIHTNVEKIIHYQEQLKNATKQEKPKIEEKINRTYQQTKVIIQKVKKVEKGMQKEAVTPAAGLIHVLGGVFGLILTLIIDRDAINYFKRDLNGILRTGKP